MHIKVEIEVPAEALAGNPDIPRLAQTFLVLFCARLLEASADLVNGNGNGNIVRIDDPGTSGTTRK